MATDTGADRRYSRASRAFQRLCVERSTALFWGLTVASAVPLFATRWLPFADLPEHVAAIGSLHRLVTTGTTHDNPYVLDLARSQYVLFHAAGALVMVFARDAVLATQLLLAAVAVAWPIAFRRVLRAFGRDERLALFAPMVFWNRALVMGFVPFVASVPIALFALASLVGPRRGRRAAVTLGGLAVILFYTHVSAWSVFIFVAGAFLVTHHVVVNRTGPRRVSRIVRGLAKDAAPLLPSLVAALVWARAGSLAGRAIPSDDSLGRMGLLRSFHALPIWSFDIWRSHADELFAGLWWLAFVLVVALRRPGGSRAPLVLFVPVACALVAYLVTPFRVGMASMLNVRLAPLVTLLALLPLELPKGRRARLPMALVSLATLGTAGLAAYEMRVTSREMVGDLDGLLAQMRPGSRVAMLSFHRTSARMHFWPYIFAGSYHRAEDGGVAAWSFSDLPHWPLHYVASEAPPARPPFAVFSPCTYRYREDGAYFDYVLVQGDVDPFATEHPGPTFTAIGRSGEFLLFAKTGAAADEAGSDADADACKDPLIAAAIER